MAAPAAAQETEIPIPIPRPPASPVDEAPQPPVTTEEEAAEIPDQNIPVFDPDAQALCERALRQMGVGFSVGDDIADDPPCGVQRPIALEAFGNGVRANGENMLNCATALAISRWVSQVVAPTAKLYLDAELKGVDLGTSYQCRRRNNAATGKLSEHAFGNGIDISGFRFEERSSVPIVERMENDELAAAKFQAAVRGGACAYFTTVLGPATNSLHATHFHLDLAIRNGGYRLCE